MPAWSEVLCHLGSTCFGEQSGSSGSAFRERMRGGFPWKAMMVAFGLRSLAGVKRCPHQEARAPFPRRGAARSSCSRGHAGLFPLGFSPALTVAWKLVFNDEQREASTYLSWPVFRHFSDTSQEFPDCGDVWLKRVTTVCV